MRPKKNRYIRANVDVATALYFETIPFGQKAKFVTDALEEKMEREPPTKSKTVAKDWTRHIATHISRDLHDELTSALSHGKLTVYLREAIVEKVQRETGGKRRK